MKKIIIICLCLILVLVFFFDKKIIQHVLIKNLSNKIGFNLSLKVNKINYLSQQIEIKNIKIKNKKGYFNENVFEANKVLIDYRISSIFTNLIIINSVLLNKPKFYFEIKNTRIGENQKETLNDNVDLIQTIINKQSPKKYPKKRMDNNFLINSIKINSSSAYIKVPQNKNNISINLSDMNFQNIGNATNDKGDKFQHFKDVFKIILTDIYFKIPDQSLRELVRKNYKLN